MQRFVLLHLLHFYVWSLEYTHTYIHSISLNYTYTFLIICFLTFPMKSTYKTLFYARRAYISYIYFYLPESIFNARRATTPTSTGSKPMLLGLEIIIFVDYIAINANFSSHTLSNWHNVTCEL